MQSSKRPYTVDPDYELSESTIKRIKIKEDQEKKDTLENVTRIINNSFTTELSSRQSQIEAIQERIVKVRKTMHLLRYVLVKSYYNNKNCLLNAEETEESPLIDPQSRIHPAVRKVLTRDTSFSVISTSDHQSAVNQENSVKIEVPNEEIDLQKVEKCETVEEMPLNGESCDTIRNRKKTKYRVVVGNISKYMPTKNREDNSTHKWMIYVRGSKEAPNVSHFIKKVVFYLHPSYKPCDVIEVDKDPFHLSRRGWGEFPVRVRIFFHCTLNKPVDIIHNLKLDKTHTGRQTLGNETVIDLYLYDRSATMPKTDTKSELNGVSSIVKLEAEEITVKNDEISSNPSQEHDYYTSDNELHVEVDIKQEPPETDPVQWDHTYCLQTSSPDESFDSSIVYGLSGEELDESRTTEEEIVCDLLTNGNTLLKTGKQLIPQLLSKETGLKLPNITANDRINSSLVNGKHEVMIDRSKYRIDIPAKKFKGVLELLPFLFRRLPLVTNLAESLSYKCLYPYAAKTLDQYLSWNVGKRLSSEWRRAKTILHYLQSSRVFEFEKWNTKLLIMYGRAHAYTPSCTYTLFGSCLWKKLLTVYRVRESLKKPLIIPEPNVPIDIIDVNNEQSPDAKLSKSCVLSSNGSLECSFIRKVMLDARIKLHPEEIAPGVLCNAAEIMIWESLKCLVNDLVRNARTHCVFRGNFNEETSTIEAEDVLAAVNDRVEFQKIMQSWKSKSDIEYFL